jgi:phosphoglycolate phosphatase
LLAAPNKAEQFTLPILKDLGIFDEFGIVISGDTLAKKKPDPLPLLHAAKFFGVKQQSVTHFLYKIVI